eukprot:7387018-Prymnesium_polylepis.2
MQDNAHRQCTDMASRVCAEAHGSICRSERRAFIHAPGDVLEGSDSSRTRSTPPRSRKLISMLRPRSPSITEPAGLPVSAGRVASDAPSRFVRWLVELTNDSRCPV